MIDTDKCEELLENGMQHRDLWELASELLAEVKRLREQLDNVRHWVSSHEDEHMMEMFKMWIGDEEE